MENWLFASLPVILKALASVIIIMLVVLLIVRVAGLRTFAKMSSIDFASTVAIGSIMANAITSSDLSLTKSGLAIATIVGVQQLFAYVKRRSTFFEAVTENQPLLLMDGPDILEGNLDKSGVTHSDLMAKLREANVIEMSEVKAVILETTGDISVLHSSGEESVATELLEGVQR